MACYKVSTAGKKIIQNLVYDNNTALLLSLAGKVETSEQTTAIVAMPDQQTTPDSLSPARQKTPTAPSKQITPTIPAAGIQTTPTMVYGASSHSRYESIDLLLVCHIARLQHPEFAVSIALCGLLCSESEDCDGYCYDVSSKMCFRYTYCGNSVVCGSHVCDQSVRYPCYRKV